MEKLEFEGGILESDTKSVKEKGIGIDTEDYWGHVEEGIRVFVADNISKRKTGSGIPSRVRAALDGI